MESEEVDTTDTICNSEINDTVAEPAGKRWWRTLCEIPLLFFFFTYSLSDNVVSNLILYRTCTVTYGFDETNCSLLISAKGSNDTKAMENIVQPHATQVIMVKTLVEGIFPSIISLFLGPWSDLHGRKPLIVSALIGFLIYFLALIGYSLWTTLEPWWIITAVIPFSISGGISTLITGVFCYVSDLTEKSNRSYRIALQEGVLLVGILLGLVCSPFAFQTMGYTWLFAVCCCLVLYGITYSVLYLDESIRTLPAVADRRRILEPSLVIEMLRTCVKARPNYCRAIIWLTMLTSSLAMFAFQGDSTLDYLFMREKFTWKLNEFSMYSAFSIVMTIIGTLFVSFFLQRCLHFRDSIISTMAYFSSAARSLIVSFAFETWHLYLGSGVTCLRAVAGPINRSILSKVVPREEVGKVMSLTSSLENIIPLISSPLYSLLYHHTLLTFPVLSIL